jgi:hypothetical protein
MEAAVIAKARPTSCILKLKRDRHSALGTHFIYILSIFFAYPNVLGLKGHMITFAQKPETIFEKTSLPASSHDLGSMIHIIFVYQKSAPNDLPTLQSSKSVLTVNRLKIFQWLTFLKQHNPYYAQVTIDIEALNTYSNEDQMPESLENTVSIVEDTERTDIIAEEGAAPGSQALQNIESANQLQHSLVFEDTIHYKDLFDSVKQQLATSNSLKRKFDEHQTVAMIAGNQFFNSRDPGYYACLFPVLFPLGIGTPNCKRPSPLPLKHFVKRSLSIESSCFRDNALWLFLCFDQLRQIEIFSSLKVRLDKMPFSTLSDIKNLTLDQIQEAITLKNQGHTLPDGHPTKPLMTALRLSGGELEYTQEFRGTARDEILATIIQHGSPSLYITISPADHKHILSYAFSNKTYEFDPNNLPPALFDTNFRNKLAAEHPVDNSQFFHVIIREIIGSLFGFERPDQSGIFGPVQTYYGMVESQNRGTLHIHMLLWLKGAPSPDDLYRKLQNDTSFQRRLFNYLDQIINQDLSYFPPYSQESEHSSESPVAYNPLFPPQYLHTPSLLAHLHKAIKEFQTHTHMATCFKNRSERCRMRKPSPLYDEPIFDPATGEIHQRRLHGMINAFNTYLTLIANSNTDIQFLLKTKSCLSVMYYITNYITKNTDGVNNYYAIMHAAKASVINNPITTIIPGLSSLQLHVRALLIRIHSMLNSANQICSNIVATMLLGLPMSYKFDEYVIYFYIHKLQLNIPYIDTNPCQYIPL